MAVYNQRAAKADITRMQSSMGWQNSQLIRGLPYPKPASNQKRLAKRRIDAQVARFEREDTEF